MGSKRDRVEAMSDDELADIYLIGNDGSEVACNKAFLAAQSPVFKRMFFKNFREQASDRFPMSFHSLVITMIKKYCNAGEMDLDLLIGNSISLKQQANFLVEARDAVIRFELDELALQTERKIGDLVFDDCAYAGAILSELKKRHRDRGPFWGAIFEFAVLNPMACFGPRPQDTQDSNNTYHPHPAVLAQVLDRVITNNVKDSVVVVRCLQHWFAQASEDENAADEEYQDTRCLVEIARRVDLKQLDMGQLSKTKPCNLFSMEQIFEAFIHHGSQTVTTPEIRRPQEARKYHVCGAGKEFLNGIYKYFTGPLTCRVLYKKGQYEGQPCHFVFQYKAAEGKWILSMTRDSYDTLNAKRHLESVETTVHFYESSSSLANRIPFNGWTTLQAGCDPAPMISRIFRTEEEGVEGLPHQPPSREFMERMRARFGIDDEEVLARMEERRRIRIRYMERLLAARGNNNGANRVHNAGRPEPLELPRGLMERVRAEEAQLRGLQEHHPDRGPQPGERLMAFLERYDRAGRGNARAPPRIDRYHPWMNIDPPEALQDFWGAPEQLPRLDGARDPPRNNVEADIEPPDYSDDDDDDNAPVLGQAIVRHLRNNARRHPRNIARLDNDHVPPAIRNLRRHAEILRRRGRRPPRNNNAAGEDPNPARRLAEVAALAPPRNNNAAGEGTNRRPIGGRLAEVAARVPPRNNNAAGENPNRRPIGGRLAEIAPLPRNNNAAAAAVHLNRRPPEERWAEFAVRAPPRNNNNAADGPLNPNLAALDRVERAAFADRVERDIFRQLHDARPGIGNPWFRHHYFGHDVNNDLGVPRPVANEAGGPERNNVQDPVPRVVQVAPPRPPPFLFHPPRRAWLDNDAPPPALRNPFAQGLPRVVNRRGAIINGPLARQANRLFDDSDSDSELEAAMEHANRRGAIVNDRLARQANPFDVYVDDSDNEAAHPRNNDDEAPPLVRRFLDEDSETSDDDMPAIFNA